MTDLELLTVGRVSTDLYAEQLGVGVERVETFRKSIGGTATNVAVRIHRPRPWKMGFRFKTAPLSLGIRKAGTVPCGKMLFINDLMI